jgi:hypothetical protein
MSTSVRSRTSMSVIEPSTDFPTFDDGEPVHQAPLRIAALAIIGALVVAAVVGFVVGSIL